MAQWKTFFSLLCECVFIKSLRSSKSKFNLLILNNFSFINFLRIVCLLYFDYTHLPNSSQLHPSSLPTQLGVLISPISSTTVCAAHLLLGVGCPLEHGGPASGHTLKNWSSLPQQLSMDNSSSALKSNFITFDQIALADPGIIAIGDIIYGRWLVIRNRSNLELVFGLTVPALFSLRI